MTRDETLESIWHFAPARSVVGGQRCITINRGGASVQVPLTELTDQEIAWLPKQAPQPAESRGNRHGGNIAAPQSAGSWLTGRRKVALAVLGLIALAGVFYESKPTTQKGTTTQTTGNASNVQATSASPSPPLPELQQKFLSISDDFAAKYQSATNEMAQGALRVQRAKAICDLFQSPGVKDWVGTVQRVSSDNEGKGVLNVSMSKIANAKTWNNALSDIGDKTLIEPGTPLHDAAVQLNRNDTITFSGTFFRSDKDCFREGSLTQKGSMTDPDWIFRFSSVKPAK